MLEDRRIKDRQIAKGLGINKETVGDFAPKFKQNLMLSGVANLAHLSIKNIVLKNSSVIFEIVCKALFRKSLKKYINSLT